MSEQPKLFELARREWMAAMAAFCVCACVFLIYRDLPVPEVRDVEVWLGFELRGRAALFTAPLHWALLAVGAWAYWTKQRWIALATALYLFYVAVSHLIWSEASPHGRGWPMGLLQAAGFSALGTPFLFAHRRERSR
jgi:hypothetical protein